MKEPRPRHDIAQETKSLEENKTSTIEDLLPGKKPISCKWVDKVKYKLDGTIERYKAHLMVIDDH